MSLIGGTHRKRLGAGHAPTSRKVRTVSGAFRGTALYFPRRTRRDHACTADFCRPSARDLRGDPALRSRKVPGGGWTEIGL